MTEMVVDPFSPLAFRRGYPMRNRMMLAPLTNQQSHPDGVLSDEERRWLTMRAEGGFGAVMTAAAHVQAVGQGFAGQLGVFDDKHIAGLIKLSEEIRITGALAFVQLHHAGNRSPRELIGEAPVSSSADDNGARALSGDEVHRLRDDFVAAAVRCKQAGMDGVEIHGAHGYIVAQFLSPEINKRTDEYGGSFENRCRLLMEIIEGIRRSCGENFIVGVRISPERYGIVVDEAVELARLLLVDRRIDFLEVSMWDTFKSPGEDPSDGDGTLLADRFTGLPRDGVALGMAGKLYQPADVTRALGLGCDFVSLGRAAILNHDFPNRFKADPDYVATTTPVTRDHLKAEGVGPAFISYLSNRGDFLAD